RDAGSLPYRSVHPNAADPGFVAIAHDPLRGLRSRDNHHSVDPARDGFQIRITAVALEGLHARIHGEYIVPALFQPTIDQIADRVLVVIARHSGNRDTFLSQKVVYLCFKW